MVDVPHTDVVAILTRAPSSGGKTRLFAELGMTYDPLLLRALLLDTLDNAANDDRFAQVVAVTPDSACDEVARLVPGLRTIPQGEGDLGGRMSQTMQALFAGGAARVALIGSDVPDIDATRIVEAFNFLGRDPEGLVLGPAFDGGYYLMAATRLPPVFRGVEWGTPTVLEQTRHLAEHAGWTVHLLQTAGDVDGGDDLRRAVRSGLARRTAAWASEKWSEGRQIP